ncbi:MAG: SAM-dependent methyltransferase [Pseudomonadota bacterium]|nr:MAG: SAM-dependent methyltransferase [Pseudomonadota bacterium]
MPNDHTNHAPDAGALPEPDPAALAHSKRLCAQIRAEIDGGGGRITFRRFMELALYAPGLGYYSAGSRKLGAAGDFVTAPELSPLFSRCVARAVYPVLRELADGSVLEVGAGSGAMAVGVLQELEALHCLPQQYLILELSAELRARQQQTLEAACPALLSRVHWAQELPDGFRGAVLANEVLDAMPAHRFTVRSGGVREQYVAWSDGFVALDDVPCEPRIAERVASIEASLGTALPKDYCSEINFTAEDWVRSVADGLAVGAVLLIDYGFPRHEYYHPQRHMGTLMCHYRHRVHGDPFVYPGLQDITAHVDFSAIADAAHDGGLGVAGYTTQGNFLIGSGLAELAADQQGDERRRLQTANEVKKLTLPHEMGELFKVLVLTRGVSDALPAFALRDMRARL